MPNKQTNNKRGRKPANTKPNYRKRRNCDDEREMDYGGKSEGSRDRSNDVAWYAKNAELFKSAGSVGFANVAGTELPWLQAQAVPGVMTFGWTPSLGGGDETAVNQAANSIYSFVVHANSRNQSYDAPDLMMMILAGAQLFSTIAHGLRVYGIMRRFDGMNQYTPKALVSAMGFDYDDLKLNLSNMWFDINHLIAQTNQIWIPNDIPLVERWYWMNSNVYVDGNSAKAQYYMYVPDVIYQLNETASEEGTSLQRAVRPTEPTKPASFVEGALWKWDEYLKLVQTMIDALVGSQDRGVIMGDILKAYGLDHIYALSPVTSEYTTTPVYNQEVLSQFENLICFPYAPGAITQSQVTRRIHQSANSELNVAVSALSDTPSSWNVLLKSLIPSTGVLNFHFAGQPTPEQIMVATRMMILGLAVDDATNEGVGDIYPQFTGSEYCTSIKTWVYWYDPAVATPIMKTHSRYGDSYVAAQSTINNIHYYIAGARTSSDGTNYYLSDWTAFDWAPAVYFNSVVDDKSSGSILANNMKRSTPGNVLVEYDNYAIINVGDLRKLHTAALLSEFGVPKI